MIDINNFFKHSAAITEAWLDGHLAQYSEFTSKLTEAMRYSVFAGGKRLRPALIYASYGIFSENEETAIPYAASIEVLHTYSLIHDDLPAMDNDDLRRGKPTNHKVFGDAAAILAGDALLTKAFEIISDPANTARVPDNIKNQAIYNLACAAGDRGMVGGQFADVRAENSKISKSNLEFIHLNKTAALLRYCSSLGAVLNGCCGDDVSRLDTFGKCLGLSFQIVDDILDVTSTTEILGKNAGSDDINNKATYPHLYGIERSKEIACDYIKEALESIKPYGKKGETLCAIAEFVLERSS